MATPRPWLTFNRLVLIAGFLVGTLIAFGPLLREIWARYTWSEIPCYAFSDKPSFVFRLHDKSWVCARPNMWFVPHADATPTMVPAPPDNATCFVNGSNPPIAVHRLDTAQHLRDGLGNYVAGALIAAASVVFVIRSSAHARKSAASPAHHA